MADINDKPMLAVDCSTTTASIALAVHGAIHTQEIPHGQQAALLVPAIDALLKAHGVAYADLGHLLTTIGPGSFTGLRIALACIHALALAHAIKLKAITSLQSVAWDVANEAPEHFHVALNAGKGEVFLQAFTQQHGIPSPASTIAMVKPETLPLQHCYGNVPPASPRVPLAATLCRIADQLPETALAEVLPLYIRPPDATPGALPPWLQTT